MNNITELKGNIFTTKCQTIVNTVNCVGVMGAGIAYECRLRYPAMFEQYVKHCQDRMINIGSLWLWKDDSKWILNFPTKTHWKYPSLPEYLEKGLMKFVSSYKQKGIESIAFPILGSNKGGIPENISLSIMRKYLLQCDIPIEIYHYDEYACDDLYLKFRGLILSIPERELSANSGLRIDFVHKLRAAMDREDIRSLSRLLSVHGIGDLTLEKLFRYIIAYKMPKQLNIDFDQM